MSEKVLVVEDDQENVALYDTFLNDDFNLLIAKNGDDAVRMICDDRPKAVLMDLALDLWRPPTNGFDLTRRIRELPEGRAIPIIAVSACCTEHERQRAVDAGCLDLMSKPIEFDELIKRLKDLVA